MSVSSGRAVGEAIFQAIMRKVFSDHRIWVSSGTHWIIAPFDVSLFNPKCLTVQCKVYAMLVAAYICRFHEWPEELSPLMMLQFIIDHNSFQEEQRTGFIPIGAVCRYHRRAAAKLSTWHNILQHEGDGFFNANGRNPPRTDPVYELCIDATGGVDVSLRLSLSMSRTCPNISLISFRCFARISIVQSSPRNNSHVNCNRTYYLVVRNIYRRPVSRNSCRV